MVRAIVVILLLVPVASDFDFEPIEVLTFDCYGTLIDWESGLLSALRAVVGNAGTDDDVLEAYGRAEAGAEAGAWLPYRHVLQKGLTEVCAERGLTPTDQQLARFGASVAEWPAFPDSAAALANLRRRFKLGVVTNCDDDLFAASNRKLGEPFDWIITAQQAQSYKPSRHNFELALERIGRPARSILHVAQSLYHDHLPAQAMGLATAWINRRHDRPGLGATPAASAKPNLAAPDMASFATLALAR
jgi:2-haloacid dehalogenase